MFRKLSIERLDKRVLLAADVSGMDESSSDFVPHECAPVAAEFANGALKAEGEARSGDGDDSLGPQDGTTLETTLAVDTFEVSVAVIDQLLAGLQTSQGDQLLSIEQIDDQANVDARLDDGLLWLTWLDPESPASIEVTALTDAGSSVSLSIDLQGRDHMHGPHSEKMMEHRAMLRVFPRDASSAIAISNGPWSSASTWHLGRLPVEGSRVLIPEGVSVTYDEAVSPPLHWIRVDGKLQWSTTTDTQLTVESLMSNTGSAVALGTSEAPVGRGVTAEILIDTTKGAIDQAEDPTLVSRGLILHGSTDIHGAVKTSKVTLAQDARAGDSVLHLTQTPADWQVGDILLLPGTYTDRSLDPSEYDAADARNARFHDELLQITAIDGTAIEFANITDPSAGIAGTTLLWDHVRPDGDTFDPEELSLYLANLSRNVIVRSSDPTVDTQERGHVMIMHNPDADIRYAQFKDLGRSDKRLVVDDPIENFDGSPGYGTNPRGRYGLHLHRVGARSYDSDYVEVIGNVVWGTPGWGIVQHDSHAMLRDNIVFDVAGAGIVAENGNEIGEWSGNLVVKITGDLVNDFDDGAFFNERGTRFDLGFTGSGYWVQGGGFGILMTDNVAASINGAGFDLAHHTGILAHEERLGPEMIADPDIRRQFMEAGVRLVSPNNIPMRGMSGVEVYNAYRGIHTWLHNRDSGSMENAFSFHVNFAHDFDSIIRDYEIWGVLNGIHNFYSTRFDFLDGLIIGNVDDPVVFRAKSQGNNARGVGVSHNAGDANRIDFDGLRVEGFEYGFQVFDPASTIGDLSRHGLSSLSNASFANNSVVFSPSSSVSRDYSELFRVDNVFSDQPASPPTPLFSSVSVGGLAIRLDASESVAADPRWGGGIVAYAWDLDDDGDYDDAIGANVQHTFAATGTYQVGLKVWDAQANVGTIYQPVDVSYEPIENMVADPGFSGPLVWGNRYRTNSQRYDGWGRQRFELQDGIASNVAVPSENGALAQVILDNHRVTGEIRLSFDAQHISEWDGDFQVSLFGIDGQFYLSNGYGANVERYDLLTPPRSQLLLRESIPVELDEAWNTMQYTAGVGNGFEYYVLQFTYKGREAARGDVVALRNVTLTPSDR